MTTANTSIDRFLARVAEILRTGQTTTHAQADVITRVADDPRPVLGQFADTLRFMAKDLTAAADRAEDLAKAWPEEPSR